ncbi:MAG: hypothetical protein H7Y17_08465 [Chlorobia bacterium]|nr:hypothetical protein [Fimbriimonadaceae bacterium]
MKRIIYTVATGPNKYSEMAMGLARSLNLLGDKTPRVVVTDNKNYDWSRYFDQVVEPKDDGTGSIYFAKLTALERTDADQVIFIDSDCLAFKSLDPVFDLCEGSGLAATGTKATTGVWYTKTVADVCRDFKLDWLPVINTGVLFYERTSEGEKLITEARSFISEYQAMGFELLRGNPSDEPCISMAMATTGLGKVLPLELNLNESGVGLIGKLEMDVIAGRCKFLSGNPHLRRVEPIVFHAHYFSKFRIYWRELKRLEDLERYLDSHKPRFMSRGTRIRRTIEKRYLKMIGKI